MERIHWAFTFMKKGRAAEQVNRWLQQEAKSGLPCFADWGRFVKAFEELFCPVNEQENAVITLESDSYHQGRRTVEEYTDRFKDLTHRSGYSDDIVITVKYRRGLNASIEADISNCPGCPAFNDVKGWYQAAILLDRSRRAHEAFKGSGSMVRSTKIPTPSTTSQRPATFNTIRLPAPPSAPVTTLSPGVPMDIDAHRQRRPSPISPIVCYRCQATGHLAKACPQRFDIRLLMAEERQEYAEAFMAELDVPEVVETTETVPTEDGKASEPQDFHANSG
jgi:hypothetical protein